MIGHTVNLHVVLLSRQRPISIGKQLLPEKWDTWMGLRCCLIGDATKAAAKTAYTELHHGGDESPYKSSPLFGYCEERLQILLIGYVLRVAETMSYRTEEVLPYSGWSWWNRALRDTFCCPENSFFRAPNDPEIGSVLSITDHFEKAQALLPVFLTHTLCNWFISPFFSSLRSGGEKEINSMWNPEELSFIKRNRE